MFREKGHEGRGEASLGEEQRSRMQENTAYVTLSVSDKLLQVTGLPLTILLKELDLLRFAISFNGS